MAQSKELATIEQLKMSFERLGDNVAFYDASAERLKGDLLKETADGNALWKSFYSTRAHAVESWNILAAEDVLTMSIVQVYRVTLSRTLKKLIENFCTGLNRSVSHAFRIGPIGVQFHPDTTIDGITFRCSGGAALEKNEAPTISEDQVDPKATPESSSCRQYFPFTFSSMYGNSCFLYLFFYFQLFLVV